MIIYIAIIIILSFVNWKSILLHCVGIAVSIVLYFWDLIDKRSTKVTRHKRYILIEWFESGNIQKAYIPISNKRGTYYGITRDGNKVNLNVARGISMTVPTTDLPFASIEFHKLSGQIEVIS